MNEQMETETTESFVGRAVLVCRGTELTDGVSRLILPGANLN
jgi:hypothetical protein